MNYAIIAAGEGSRLVEEGVSQPKPLVELNGTALIDRLINTFLNNNAESISIIINEEMKTVRQHLDKIKLDIPLNLIVHSTPSSMHSFFELSRFLSGGKFCLTTIDTVFDEDEFACFIRAFEQDNENDGMMAVTNYIDDEKPLYILVDKNAMLINGFLDAPEGEEICVSGGIYGLNSKSIPVLHQCLEAGISRMRNYQRQLIANGLRLKAYPFEKIIDVDHAEDIKKAEDFLSSKSKINVLGFHLQSGNKPNIIGVSRFNLYSPNHIGNDAAIFNLTVQHLKEMNCAVTSTSEPEFLKARIDADVIFNMARDTQTIQKLKELEDKGKRVINSGYGIENCTRAKMTRILLDNDIPHPKSLIVSTLEKLPAEAETLGSHCWIKRGDFHAIHYEDVTYSRNGKEAENIINEYRLRGIPNAVLNEHLKGDLVKFYGIKNTGFFYWFYPNDLNHSKFRLEKINGKAIGISFDVAYLKEVCDKAASVLNIYIYGGDCVIDESGTFRIIDFNDWPSFAPCRTEAAPYIAQCIYDFATQ
jgi:NDP-sugar pyrophosphorylase family protein